MKQRLAKNNFKNKIKEIKPAGFIAAFTNFKEF